MSYEDVIGKWLSVAYSSKRKTDQDFRHIAATRGHFAGSKGIGRFSSDRLGSSVTLQTRPKSDRSGSVHRLAIDWLRFEDDDLERFEEIPVTYTETGSFDLPEELQDFAKRLKNGTVVEIGDLRQPWDRDALKRLKSALAKLINPFGAETDDFSISILALDEIAEDRRIEERATAREEELSSRDVVNGKVGNFIFSTLREKTTFITVKIEKGKIVTTLTDRGELIYAIREPNDDYKLLNRAAIRCDLFYLNQSARVTFARRVGLPSVRFGSVFLFRNGFRVYPIGEETDDWFGFNRRKQQGHSRYLGGREIIGRLDVVGDESDFQEASSRNQGLIGTPAVKQLQKFFMEHCLRRLERYVVPVSWPDTGEANAENISRLLTDPGRARVTAAVADLVDNDEIELLDYSKQLITILNERSTEFESSIAGLRAIAEKVEDKSLLRKISAAERRFEELRQAEAEARRIADEEREATRVATERAETAEAAVEEVKEQVETEKRRSHFLETIVDLDAATILNLHHQVTIYSVSAGQQIENFLNETVGQKAIPRETVLKAFEQIAYLNAKIYAVARFAARATFKLDSEKIRTDLPTFIADYIREIAKQFSSARLKIDVENSHSGMEATFNPIDVSIIVDNLISNATKARASRISFIIKPDGKNGMQVEVVDNGKGIPANVDKDRIFEMGYTTTRGSGLGLYHVRHMLGLMGGTIELLEAGKGNGTAFLIKIVAGKKKST